jgi:hypothetical protein
MTTEQEAVRDIGIQLLMHRRQLGDDLQRCSDPACNGWRLSPVVTQRLQELIQEAAGVGPWEVSSAMSDDLRFVRLTLTSQVPVNAHDAVMRRILDQSGGMVVMTEDGVPWLTDAGSERGPLLNKILDALGIQAPTG